MNHLHSLILAITLLLVSVSVATAQDFNKGLEAYNTGDYQTALQEWLPLVQQGNAAAQFYLGLMYENGRGVAQDEEQAVTFYGRAAQQGNASAQSNLVYIAQKGNGSAQLHLGKMYEKGWGVAKDHEQAVTWYRLAAEQGKTAAKNNLVYIAEQGNA